MEEPLLTLPSRQELFRAYDHQRRLRLILVMAPVQLATDIIGFLIFFGNITLQQHTEAGPMATIPLRLSLAMMTTLLTLALGYAWVIMAARRGQVALASGLLIAGTSLTIISVEGIWIAFAGMDVQGAMLFAAFGIAIVIAGAVGERWMLIATTVGMNLFTVVVLWAVFLATGHDTSPHHQVIALIGGDLLEQWSTAFLLITMQQGYRRIVGDLGDTRYAVERAKRLDVLKNQFISSVNHELRNPIMALQGYMETVLQGVRHREPYGDIEQQALQANRIGDDLATLVQSILEVRALDQGPQALHPSAVPLRAAIEQAARLIDPREAKLVERELRVHVPDDLAIWGETTRLQQVLTNLLSNAIKYSPAGTPVEVSASVMAAPAEQRRQRQQTLRDEVEVRVRDYGHGIPPEHIPLLFNRFVRLQRDLTSNVTGNGLGLYISKGYVEAMGGRIWVESTGEAGAGSTFIMRLLLPPGAAVGTTHDLVVAPAITSSIIGRDRRE